MHTYQIRHNHVYDFGNQVTQRRVQNLNGTQHKSYYGRHQSLVDRFHTWKDQGDKSDNANPEKRPQEDEQCFLNLRKKHRKEITCSRCLQPGHNKQSCENEPASAKDKRDFELQRATVRKRDSDFKLRRRIISKRSY